MKLFGFEIKRFAPGEEPKSFAPPVSDDGGIIVTPSGFYGSYVDLEGSAKSETELVTRYREMAMQPEIEQAVDEITNEAISASPENKICSIILDDIEVSPKIKAVIEDEFEHIMKLLNFNNKAYEIFRQWYIDGRLFFHAIVDQKNSDQGIQELRYIDPRMIKKVRELKTKDKTIGMSENEAVKTTDYHEYFVYSNKGFEQKDYSPKQALKIAKDSIVYVTSGLMDRTNQLVLSYLHKAIKPLNQLRILEDATVIYRISRAPERRIFYIDVGNLPKMKAEQYLRDMMVKHKNRLVYNAETGDVRDDRKFMTMIEDYWLPRREGGKGTEITTLPGGQNLGEMTDVEYFQQKLYQSLNIPIDRLTPNAPFSVGNTNEITRDEIKFFKFIQRLRLRFAMLFINILEKQLILKNILTWDEWAFIKDSIRFDFISDNYFAELKETQILKERLNTVAMLEPYVGVYYSEEFIRRNILKQNDEDIEQINNQIMAETPIIAERRIQKAELDGTVEGKQIAASMIQQLAVPQPEPTPTNSKNK